LEDSIKLKKTILSSTVLDKLDEKYDTFTSINDIYSYGIHISVLLCYSYFEPEDELWETYELRIVCRNYRKKCLELMEILGYEK
jgi:hypothetical protein